MKRKAGILFTAFLLIAGAAAADETLYETDNFHNTDTFEDGDISEYSTATSGSSFSVTSGSSYIESNGLRRADGSGSAIYTDSVTVEPGQTISGYAKKDSGENGEIWIHFGGTSSGKYALTINPSGDSVVLRERYPDQSDVTLASKSDNIPSGVFIRYEIHWQEDGTITAELYDEGNGNYLTEISTTSNTFGEGGIGFGGWGGGIDYDSSPAINEHYMRNGGAEGPYTGHSGVPTTTADYYSGDESWYAQGLNQFQDIFNLDQTNLGRLQDGETYKYSYYARSGASQDVNLGFAGCGGMGIETVSANSGWTKYEGTFTVGSDCNQNYFQSRTGYSGTIYLDRFSLYKVSGSEDSHVNPWEQQFNDAYGSGNGGKSYTQPMWDGLSLHRWATSSNAAVIGKTSSTSNVVEIDTELYLGESGGADGATFTVWGNNQYPGGSGGLDGGWTVFFDDYGDSIKLKNPSETVVDSVSMSESSGWHNAYMKFDRNNGNRVVDITFSGNSYSLNMDSSTASGTYIGAGAWSGGIKDSFMIRDTTVNDLTPQVSNSQPAEGSTVRSPVDFSATFNDQAGLDSYTLYLNGNFAGGGSLLGTQETVSRQDIEVQSGSNTYTWEVTDSDGNTGRTSYTFEGDKAPTGSENVTVDPDDDLSPNTHKVENGEFWNAEDGMTVDWEVQDDQGLNEMEIVFDGQTQYSENLSGTSVSGSTSFSPPAEGPINVTVRARDDLGWETVSYSEFTIDNTGPDANIVTQELNGQEITDGETYYFQSPPDLFLEANAPDSISGLQYAQFSTGQEEGGTIVPSGNTYNDTFTNLQSGNFTIDTTAYDNAQPNPNPGTDTGKTFEVVVDSEKPTIENVDFNYVPGTAVIDGTNLTIEADISDNDEIQSVEWNLDSRTKTGQSPVYFENVDEGKYNWVPDTSTNQIWENVTITATDEAGNSYTWTPSIRSGSNGLFYEFRDETFIVDVSNPSILGVDRVQNEFGLSLSNIDMDDNVGISHLTVSTDADGEGGIHEIGKVCDNDPDNDGDNSIYDLDSDPVKSWIDGCDEERNINDYKAGGSGELLVGEGATIDADLSHGMHTFVIDVYDGNRHEEGLAFDYFIDKRAPNPGTLVANNLDGDEENIRANDTLEFELEIKEDSKVQEAHMGLFIGSRTLVGSYIDNSSTSGIDIVSPELTKVSSNTWRVEISLWDAFQRSNRCTTYECTKEFFERIESGNVEAEFYLEDDRGNKRIAEYITPLYYDNDVDFQNWRATSPLNETTINASFESEDDFSQFDSMLLQRTNDPQLEWYNVNNTCYASSSDCTVQDNHELEITNDNPTDILLYHSGDKVMEIPENTTKTLWTGGNYSLKNTQFWEVFESNTKLSEFADRFYGYRVLKDISASEWDKESGNETNTFSTGINVGTPGQYLVRLNLTDTANNNEQFERTAIVRPNSRAGQFYQFLYNVYGFADWISGLILFLPVTLGGAIMLQWKQRNSTILTKLWMFGSVGGFLYWGGLPFQIHILAAFVMVGLILNQLNGIVWGRG